MIDRRTAIVLDRHYGIVLLRSGINDVVFSLCYTGRDKDCPGSGSGKTARFVDFKQTGVFPMADNR